LEDSRVSDAGPADVPSVDATVDFAADQLVHIDLALPDQAPVTDLRVPDLPVPDQWLPDQPIPKDSPMTKKPDLMLGGRWWSWSDDRAVDDMALVSFVGSVGNEPQ
jgi:hypothetical protein